MKRLFFTLSFLILTVRIMGQVISDPTLMTINGKDVTRAEFEYSYNKNGNIEGAVEKKTVEEYADMFVNYKLKVAAAEAAKMDTLPSFIQEFRTYRDMQLTPHMVDQSFIDSVALSLYNRSKESLGGKDMLHCSHILISVPQNATDDAKETARLRADSIYKALLNGADFAETAIKVSQDPGSAPNGGQLPWIGPGSVLKEFEEAAYNLKVGEISAPVLTSVGYHIIKMNERKQLEPYEELKDNIISSLKRQGIEEASAQKRIEKIMAQTGKTREEVMDSVLQACITETPDLKYLIQEYHDGLLLYEASKQLVWDVAAKDDQGLEKYYKKHKKEYKWDEPRFSGFVYHMKSANIEKEVQKFLKKNAQTDDWRKELKQTINKDSSLVVVSGPFLAKKGENPVIDQFAFKTGEARSMKNYPYAGLYGKMQKQPKSYRDVRSDVLSDYQQELEKQWIEELRKEFPFSINKEVLNTVNKH